MSGAHAAHLAALETLQESLAALYRVEESAPIGAFVLDEEQRAALAGLGALVPREDAREEVYVLDDGHEVSVGVFVDERAREAASDAIHDGSVLLSPARFADFCVALEGVSHFLLMQHRALLERPVTQLELELQAEVDKYVMARLCPWTHAVQISDDGSEPRVTAQTGERVPSPAAEQLTSALFDDYELAAHLCEDQAERYVVASRLARRYCRRLERAYLGPSRRERLLSDLCAFFRQSQEQRLSHIGA